jgi:hypothetical protein
VYIDRGSHSLREEGGEVEEGRTNGKWEEKRDRRESRKGKRVGD